MNTTTPTPPQSNCKSFTELYCLAIYTFIFFTPFFGSSQNTQTIYEEYKGVVLDVETDDPIPFASLTVQGSNIAGATNSEGQFSLKVAVNNAKSKVEVSALGYKKLLIILSDFSDDTVIVLTPEPTQLAEVNIKRPKDALTLVRSVFTNRGDNYLTAPTYMTAFYRETIQKRRSNVSLAEAVVNIKKREYQSGARDLVSLYKARKNTNYEKLDTVALKLEGGPFNTLYTDVMKYPEYFMTPETLGFYDFDFDESTVVNGELIYVVNFKQRKDIRDPMYFGRLFINAETSALTNADYALNVNDREMASKLFVRKKPSRVDVWPTEATYRVDYREEDGKWYYGYSRIQLEFVVNWKRKFFNSRYRVNSEMLITDWEEETGAQAMEDQENYKSRTVLADEASGFNDPDFWGSFNVIEPEKSIESAIDKIQRQLRKEDN